MSIDTVRWLWGDPMEALSTCVRSLIVPREGHKFVCADYSSIESRKLAWLCGNEDKLEVFRTHGKVYEYVAAQIYNCDWQDIGKESRERFIGKTAELACGFQGWVGAFTAMAGTLGEHVDEETALTVVSNWREANPETVTYWRLVEDAAFAAIRSPGSTHTVLERVAFKTVGSYLACRLPSGRCIFYAQPRIAHKPAEPDVYEVTFSDGDKSFTVVEVSEFDLDVAIESPGYVEHTLKQHGRKARDVIKFMGVDGTTKKWCQQETYGGKLTENITQASARDVLAAAILRLQDAKYFIPLTVHDEIIAEVPDTPANADALERMVEIMNEPPRWARDLPVASEGWEGYRYRK